MTSRNRPEVSRERARARHWAGAGALVALLWLAGPAVAQDTPPAGGDASQRGAPAASPAQDASRSSSQSDLADLADLAAADSIIELAHLDHLSQLFDVEGERLRGVWIYAEPGPTETDPYVYRGAPGEGLTCVDDVARAALVYLAAARQGLSPHALAYARDQLDFVLAFQAQDGEFYNFADEFGKINRLGITSRKGAGFWAARALWAIGDGMIAFQGDADYYETLRGAFLSGASAFARNVDARWGQYYEVHGLQAPAWLPGDGADVASILLLGLSSFLEVDQDPVVLQLASRIAVGLAEFQYGPAGTYPYLAHPSFALDPFQWHAWGSRQTQALARAATVLGEDGVVDGHDLLASAEAEAGHFFVHLLVTEGPIEKMSPAVKTAPQIAFGMESLASGLFELYAATGKSVYAELGGLMTGWLTGNNELREPMYDPATGRTYDGLERGVINRNAGAESTITALLALLGARDADALGELTWQWLWKQADITLELETGTDFGEPPKSEIDAAASGQMTAVLQPGAAVTVVAEVPASAEYRVLALYRNDPWDASARVAYGRQAVGTVATVSVGSKDATTAAPYRMQDLGTVELPAGEARFIVSHEAGREMRFDALILRPVLIQKLYGREGERLLLVKSWSDTAHALGAEGLVARALTMAGGIDGDDRAAREGDGGASAADPHDVRDLTVRVYDATASLQDATDDLPPYGFALVSFASDDPLPSLGARSSGPSLTVESALAFEEGRYRGLDLGELYNNDAFSTPRNPSKGNFDARSSALGATYPAEHAPPASAVAEILGVPFYFPPTDESANNVALKGQRVVVPTGRYTTLWLLGASEQGNYASDLTLEYADGSAVSVTLGLSDWCQLPRYGERVALEFNQRRGAGGAVERITCRIFMQTIDLEPGKELTALLLPDRETMHVFAVTLEEP